MAFLIAKGSTISFQYNYLNIFYPELAEEMNKAKEEIQQSRYAGLFYKGITEEILIRFGVITFITWPFFLIFKHLTDIFY